MGKHGWLALVVWLSLAPPAASQNVSSANRAVESTASQLTHALRARGFEVGRGYPKLWAIGDCDYTYAKIGTCFGNNPAAPYVVMAVPPWPEEYVDSDSNLFGPSRGHSIDVFRFDPREAIVLLAKMPPPARYFSEQTYLWTREGTFDESSDPYKDICGPNADPFFHQYCPLFFMNDPNHSGRIFAFATLSNPINNRVMLGQDSQDPFNQLRFFIITPNPVMENAVRRIFRSMGVDEKNVVFTERIPSDMVVGLDSSSDDFVVGIRYAQPEDGGAPGSLSDVWRKQLPLAVLRVRERSDREPVRFGPVVLEPRTAADESGLSSDLVNLVSAVSQRWGQPCAQNDCSDRATSFHDLQSAPTNMVGPLCVPIGENCLGDNWDAAYQMNGPHAVDNGEIYAAVGTLGTKTGNATYVGFSINDLPVFKGVANLSDGDLEGTADTEYYQGKGLGNLDQFYLYYFARDCAGLDSLTDGHCLPLDSLIPAGHLVGFGVRDYVRPGTVRGPESSLVLPSMLIKLHRP